MALTTKQLMQLSQHKQNKMQCSQQQQSQPVDNYFADDAEQYIDTNVQELDVELEADWWTTDDELSAAAGEWFNEDVMPFFSIHKDEVFGNAMAKAEATHGPLMETCGADGELCMSKINDKLVTDL